MIDAGRSHYECCALLSNVFMYFMNTAFVLYWNKQFFSRPRRVLWLYTQFVSSFVCGWMFLSVYCTVICIRYFCNLYSCTRHELTCHFLYLSSIAKYLLLLSHSRQRHCCSVESLFCSFLCWQFEHGHSSIMPFAILFYWLVPQVVPSADCILTKYWSNDWCRTCGAICLNVNLISSNHRDMVTVM